MKDLFLKKVIAELKQIIKVADGGTVWPGFESVNVLQIISQLIDIVADLAGTCAIHDYQSRWTFFVNIHDQRNLPVKHSFAYGKRAPFLDKKVRVLLQSRLNSGVQKIIFSFIEKE